MGSTSQVVGRAFTFFVLLSASLAACKSTKPCSQAGDTTWHRQIKGDKTCEQVRDHGGKKLNHGYYSQKYINGKTAVEGEFRYGKKNGFWTEYNEKGEKVLIKYYEEGVEMAPPAPKVAPALAPTGVGATRGGRS